MNDNSKPAPSKPADPTPTKTDYGKTIPVKCITFYQAHPNYNAQMSISAEPAANKNRTVIDFVPSLRHHRVEQTKVGQPTMVRFIHECLIASFEPL